MATHEAADSAIKSLNAVPLNGKPLKCSWGKSRGHEMPLMYSPQPYPYAMPAYPPNFPHAPQLQYPGGYYPPWHYPNGDDQKEEDNESTENSEQTQNPSYPIGYYAPVYYT
jgi:nucleolysin TIA-1/TIAR